MTARYPPGVVGYRDDMEAARVRIEAMEDQLRHALPATEVLRLQRELQKTERQLEKEFQRRSLAETAERELARARHDLHWLERLGTRMRSELTWSHRQLDAARRAAAKVAEREREIADLRVALDRESHRRQAAEREIGRLQICLAIERARGGVAPLSHVALDERREDLAERFALDRWPDRDDHELIDALRELAIVLGEAVWAQREGTPFDLFAELIEYLRELGHALHEDDGSTWGGRDATVDALAVTIEPFHLIVEVRRPNARRLTVELTRDGLRHVIRA